jgi:hypothetical protein
MATFFSIANYRRDGGTPHRPHHRETASVPPVAIGSGASLDDSNRGLAALTAQYYRRWQPSAVEERVLVDLLISSDWQLRRLKAIRQSRPPELA